MTELSKETISRKIGRKN